MRYRLTFPITSTHGSQTFTVEASSPQEAKQKHTDGESEFEAEEVDVMSLGEPDVEEIEPESPTSDEQPTDQLIEGLTILKKYMIKGAFPTHCVHDIMCVMVPSDAKVSTEDKARLDVLGFQSSDEFGCWASYRFGSA